MKTLDPMAAAYKKVRDATFCNEDLSNAEKLGVLEQVKYEILRDTQRQIDEG